MKKLSILFLTFVLVAGTAVAQEKESEYKQRFTENKAKRAAESDTERKQRIAEYKEKRKAYLAEKVNLSEEQASRFWPLYEEYNDKRMLLLHTFRQEMKDFKGLQSPSEKEYKVIVDSDLELKTKEVELTQEYYGKFRKILTSEQTYNLMRAEDDFAKEYMRRRMDNK